MHDHDDTPPPAVLPYRRAASAGDRPDECYRCGYPLLGIDDEHACPECGLLARRSRRQTDELHNTRPRWLRRISRGANLILLAILVAVAWPFLWAGVFRYFDYVVFGFPRAWSYLPLVGLDAGAILLAAGVFMLTSPEGYPPADCADRHLRLMLRLAAVAPLIVMLLMNAQNSLAYGSRWWNLLWSPLRTAIPAMSALALPPVPLLLFAHLRGLAKRARSAHLAEHCLIVGIGTSAAILYAIGMGVLFENAARWGLGSHWTGRSSIALGMMLLFSVSGILFILWSLYLLVCFAIAFRRASRQLRGKWIDDDKSLPTAAATP